jgi:hypothetical protein
MEGSWCKRGPDFLIEHKMSDKWVFSISREAVRMVMMNPRILYQSKPDDFLCKCRFLSPNFAPTVTLPSLSLSPGTNDRNLIRFFIFSLLNLHKSLIISLPTISSDGLPRSDLLELLLAFTTLRGPRLINFFSL